VVSPLTRRPASNQHDAGRAARPVSRPTQPRPRGPTR
jgi:hypothetical protein